MSFEELVRQQARAHGVDPELAVRVMRAESAGRPDAVSPKGATGLMQLMPGTAAELGVDPRDPAQNIAGGVRYLGQQLRAQGGDVPRALAAYNWGPGNLARQGFENAPPETRNYIARVTGAPQEKSTVAGAPQMDPFESLRPGAQTGQPAPQGPNPFLDLLPKPVVPQEAPVRPAAAPAGGGQLPPQPGPPAPPVAASGGPARPWNQNGQGEANAAALRAGLEMGPVGNFMSAIPGRVAELGGSLAARGIEAVRGPQAVADTLRAAGKARPTGFDGTSVPAKVGSFVGDSMVANRAAGLVGAGVGAAGAAVKTGAPAFARIGEYMEAAGRALASFGASSGLPVATGAQRAGDLALRSAAGAGAGYTTGQVIDPENANMSAAIGGAIPALGAVARAGGGAVADLTRPFRQGGREQIAGNILRNAAQNPAAVAQRMSQPQSSIAPLTLAERTMDPGLASLQRTMRNDSRVGPHITAFMENQNADRVRHLMSMSEGANAPDAIRAARQAATGSTYDQILARHGGDPLNTMGLRQTVANIGKTPRARTEAVAKEVRNAVTDAPGIPRFGNPTDGWRREAPMVDMWGARQNIDQRLYGGHGMDAKASAEAAAGELSALRRSMSNQLAKIPGFKGVERVYADFSSKAAAADVLVDMAKRGTTAMADMHGNPVASAARLVGALKTVDRKDWAALSAAQRASVQTLAVELQRAAKANALNMPMGSNTLQNQIATSDLMGAIKTGARLLPGGGLLSGMVNSGTDKATGRVMDLLGDAVTNPARAAQLASRIPRQYLTPELERLLAQSAAVGSARIAPPQ